jgi:hypothetical protein
MGEDRWPPEVGTRLPDEARLETEPPQDVILADGEPLVDTSSNGAAAPSSLVEALRARRAAQAAGHSHDLVVPGWKGQLVIRCGPIGGAVMTALRERAEKSRSPERDFNLNADTLIAACREVLGRASPDGDLTTLVDDDGEPVRIDSRLAELLGIETQRGRAREVLLALYAGANVPEVAIGVAGGEYMEWASSANAEVDEDLLGES